MEFEILRFEFCNLAGGSEAFRVLMIMCLTGLTGFCDYVERLKFSFS